MRRLILSFLLTLFLLIGYAIKQPRAQQNIEGPLREAIVKGQIKGALAATEVNALDAEKSRNWYEASRLYTRASFGARISGQLQKAVSHASRGFEMAQKAGDPELQVDAILRLAVVLRDIGQHAKATEWIQKGIEIQKQVPAGPRKNGIDAFLNRELGVSLLREGKTQESIEYIEYSLQLVRSGLAASQGTRGRPAGALESWQNEEIRTGHLLAIAYHQAGNVEEAIKIYEGAIETIKRSGLKSEAEGDLYHGLGQAYLRLRNSVKAQENLQKALERAEKLQDASLIHRASNGMGDLLVLSEKPSEAVPHYQKAVQQVESARSLLASQEYRQSYLEGRLEAYVNLVGVLVQVGKQEEAFNYSERARSRVFLDVLGSKVELSRGKSGLLNEERALQERISGLRALLGVVENEAEREALRKGLAEAERAYDAFLTKVRKENKEQASLMSVEPLTLQQIQEFLDPGQTLLEYFVTPEKTFLWVVDKERSNSLTIAISQKELVSRVNAVRQAISELNPLGEYQKVSQELYKLLIQPALGHIRGKEVIIVPHNVLHYVPFQALYSPQGKYLMEDYSLSYLSSASLLQFVKEKRKAKGENVLAFGNPDLGDPGMNLRFAELEAGEIAKLYPRSSVLLKKEATEKKAKILSPDNDILHFATHAELSEDDPLSSAILLARDDKEDGRLEVREIFGMDLKASLVVLSACETGLGKLSSGDELVGLTRAFIYAGTPSVVASLWKVEDSSTAALMGSFYKNLRTMSKVEALRQAQLELIRGGKQSDLLARRGVGGIGKLGEVPQAKPQSPGSASVPVSISTSHPYFWAPFILVGDGK